MAGTPVKRFRKAFVMSLMVFKCWFCLVTLWAITGESLLVTAQDSASSTPSPARPFPLPVKLIGYIVSENGQRNQISESKPSSKPYFPEGSQRAVVMLEIGNQMIVLRKNEQVFEYVDPTTHTKSRCILRFADSELDVENKTLSLGFSEPFDIVICRLGETIQPDLKSRDMPEKPNTEKSDQNESFEFPLQFNTSKRNRF